MKNHEATVMELSEALRKERDLNEARLHIVTGNVRALVLMLRGAWVQTERDSDIDRDIRVAFDHATNLLEWLEGQHLEEQEQCPDGQNIH